MGIKMFVGEVNTQTSSIKSYCTNIINGMTKIQTVLSKIILEPSLQGNTYDSAKNYFKTAYLPVTRGFILVCETAIRANQQLITDYKTNVDVNDLQEDILISQMSRLDSMSSALDSIVLPKVFTKNIIDNLQEAKGKTAKKLTQLREFNHKSVSIFEELEQQLQNLERGVALIAEGKAWNGTTGTFSTAGINIDWAQNIDYSWKERDKGIDFEKNKQLKQYDIYAMIYKDSDGNSQVMWILEKNGVRVQDADLTTYLKKAGKHLPDDMYNIVSSEVINKKINDSWKKGVDYFSGTKPKGWEKFVLGSSAYIESGVDSLTESGLWDAALILGFSISAVRNASSNVKLIANENKFNFTSKTNAHMNNPSRVLPVQTLKDAINHGYVLPDPRGSSATMYYTQININGKLYNLEVLYDAPTNTIFHFEYARKSMGNLPKIK